MGDQEGMMDEAYVSGNLSSGGFPSLGGDEKDSPCSTSSSLSLGSEAGGERMKLGFKGRDALGKGLSQLSGRRKNLPPNRRGLLYGEGKAGSATGKNLGPAAGSLPTPTTQLSKQINKMGLVSPLVTPGGKRTLAERSDDMSPMSDTDVHVGGGTSLTDPGYVSLPHGQSSLELPSSLSRERVGDGRGGEGATRAVGDTKQQDTLPTSGHKSTATERLQVDHQVRAESPGVPPVAENVEVVTGPANQELSRQSEAVAILSKRAAPGWERQRTKNPRLTEGLQPGPGALLHRPIKVPTIVSPVSSTGGRGSSSRHKTRRSGVGGLSPERPGPSRSPLSSMEEGETHRTVVSPSHHTSSGGGGGGGGPVNFRSIEELSRSDRQPDSMEVEQQRNPHMAKVMSLIRSSRESANFSSRHSPQSLRAVSPSSSSINSLNSARSVSPHSPRSPHTSLTQPNSGGSGSSGAGGDAEGRRQRVAGGGEEGGGREEEAEVKRQSALLQVSEAHLAILPDEDGDTPLHLSIIHENVRLTQHLVKLIVGVYMNLDIANNMRQTPLHLAIITRQPHIVQMLVQAGASVNFPDRKGNTALHLAAARRDMQVLKILARAASPVPDFNCKNFAGLAPVHLATRESSIDVLKFLFQMGANKNAMDACSGRTSLHYAVEAENFILVNFLLEGGCNVNSATFSGNTPLHIAAGRRLKEIVALLMAYGANPALANGEGDFPTDLPASLLMQRARMNAH